MKKILMFLMLGIFLINIVSAVDFDNKLTYSEGNKKVKVENLFGLPIVGTEIADIKITSHKDLNEPIKIYDLGYQPTLIIEGDGKEDYKDAIKGVEFKNMKTGKLEDLDYYWEKGIYGDVIISNYENVCNEIKEINGTIWESCNDVFNGTHIENKVVSWEKIGNNKDIKKGKFTLRLMVWINRGDYYDGIPTLFGKKIDKWAEWENPKSDRTYIGTEDDGTVNRYGPQFYIKQDKINVTIVTKISGDESTTAYIYNITDGSTLIAQATFVGDNATFGNVILTDKSKIYQVLGDSGGASRNTKNGAPVGGYPSIGTNVNYTCSGSITDCRITWGQTIYSITSLTAVAIPIITIVYPTATTYSSTITELNYTATSAGTLDSCWYSLNLGVTNSSRQNCGLNWTGLTADEGTNTWTVYGNLTTGKLGDTTISFTIDTINPLINVSYPIGYIDYHSLGQNLSLNWNVSDTNLGSCWYDFGGVNTTITCGTNQTYVNITNGSINSLIFYVNDTGGNWNSSLAEWNYKIFENSRSYTESTFETATETYAINLTSNSSLTAVKLIYNNESGLTMANQGSNYWTYSRDVLIGNGSFNFYYNFTYGGSYISSTNSTQQVNLTYFTPTDATYTDIFLNISFKDENSLTHINASIPSSEFIYYLGSGLVNKTLSFSNSTDNKEYTFSGTTGSKNLYVIPIVQYRRINDYPQRIWTPTVRTYTTTQTDQVLNLLSSTDGIYVTYQVLTASESTIEGVNVIATRLVSGETIQIGAGTTDAAGTITFWLNPDFQHIVTFSKTGYDDYVFTHFPTQNTYTITLGGEAGTKPSCADGITQTIKPSQDFLWANQTYNFNYTVYSSYWNLSEMKFSLTGDGIALGSDSSTSSSGDIVSVNNINTSSYSVIQMSYYYDLDEADDECGQVTGIRVWIVQSSEGTEFGIWQLTQDFNTYVSSDLYGLDDFGKTLISFVIIVLMVGGLSRRYGIASEGAIMGILFGTVFMLDVGLNMIPRVEVGDFVSVNHFFTYITFIILFVIIIKEESSN